VGGFKYFDVASGLIRRQTMTVAGHDEPTGITTQVFIDGDRHGRGRLTGPEHQEVALWHVVEG